MHESYHSPAGAAAHPQVGHVVPFWLLFVVWVALMVLTYITVTAAYIDLGNWNLIIAMVIATTKASLVVLFFMHLRWDTQLNALIFITSLVFVTIFIIFALIDTSSNLPTLIEGYAPALQQ